MLLALQEFLMLPQGLTAGSPVQISFLAICYPVLVLTYLGQAAWLTAFPDQVSSTFYASIPYGDGFFWVRRPSLDDPPHTPLLPHCNSHYCLLASRRTPVLHASYKILNADTTLMQGTLTGCMEALMSRVYWIPKTPAGCDSVGCVQLQQGLDVSSIEHPVKCSSHTSPPAACGFSFDASLVLFSTI